MCCFARFVAYHVKGRHKLPLEKEFVVHDNNTILMLKTGDQTWLRLTQLIIVVCYTTVDRYTTDIALTINGFVSAECRALYRPTYLGRHISVDNRPSVGRYVDRHIGRVSVDMSTDASVECRPIYRSIHRSRGAQNTHDPTNLTCSTSNVVAKVRKQPEEVNKCPSVLRKSLGRF